MAIVQHPHTRVPSTTSQYQSFSFPHVAQLPACGVHTCVPSPSVPCTGNQDTRHRIRIPFHTHSIVVCCNRVTSGVPHGQNGTHYIGLCQDQCSARASSSIPRRFSDVSNTGSSPNHTVSQTTVVFFCSSPTSLLEER
jgi:hypothetical protein